MKALRCLAQVFVTQGDDETALSLFTVALDGLTFMDIHRWRADCMCRIAEILKRRGEVMNSVGLWKAARPLFERASQAKDIAQIDARLSILESESCEVDKKQLRKLVELNVPVDELDAIHIKEDAREQQEKEQEGQGTFIKAVI
jgi:hypothetical protein